MNGKEFLLKMIISNMLQPKSIAIVRNISYANFLIQLQGKYSEMVLIFLLFLIAKTSAFAQEEWQEGTIISCDFSTENSFLSIPNQDFNKNGRISATSTIEVTYTDFPTNAKTAFEYAKSIWEGLLISSQKIRINATWAALSGSTLAQTGTTRIYRNFTNAPVANTWYPVALAEALIGKELNNNEADINVTFNSNVNWHYLTDAKPTAGKYDLVTVALHELAHGLGITSSFELTSSSAQAQYGTSNSAYIYDVFIQNSTKQVLTNAAVFGNPSVELKNAITSNALCFGMKNPKFASTLPKIYAPSTYRDGVSISHLDETVFSVGKDGSLMSPAVRAAEGNHVVGEVVKNMLNEMGWQITGLSGYVVTEIEEKESSKLYNIYPNPIENIVNIDFFTENTPKSIEIDLIDLGGKSLVRIQKEGYSERIFQQTLEDIPTGLYFLKIGVNGISKTSKIIKN